MQLASTLGASQQLKPQVGASLQVPPPLAAPKTDNQQLRNLQADYYGGNERALEALFLKLNTLALKLVFTEMRKKGLLFPRETVDELALDATILMVGRFKKKELVIHTSFVAYLQKQVIQTMYYRTDGQKFFAWCCKKGINFFTLPKTEQKELKQQFARENMKENQTLCARCNIVIKKRGCVRINGRNYYLCRRCLTMYKKRLETNDAANSFLPTITKEVTKC